MYLKWWNGYQKLLSVQVPRWHALARFHRRGRNKRRSEQSKDAEAQPQPTGAQGARLSAKSMNFALKTTDFALQTMDYVLFQEGTGTWASRRRAAGIQALSVSKARPGVVRPAHRYINQAILTIEMRILSAERRWFWGEQAISWGCFNGRVGMLAQQRNG